MRPEPQSLRDGKEFQRCVREAYEMLADPIPISNKGLRLLSGRQGFADAWVVYDRDPEGAPMSTMVIEVKASDWATMTPSRLRANALRYRRQILRYMAVAAEPDFGLYVEGTMIFPRKPADIYRQRVVEALFMEQGVRVHWWDDDEYTPYELFECAEEGAETIQVIRALLADLVSDRPEPAWLAKACSGVSWDVGTPLRPSS